MHDAAEENCDRNSLFRSDLALIVLTFVDPGLLGAALKARPSWRLAATIGSAWTLAAMLCAGVGGAAIALIAALAIVTALESAVTTLVLRLLGESAPYKLVLAIYVHTALVGAATYYTIVAVIANFRHTVGISTETLMPNLGWIVAAQPAHRFAASVDPISLWAATVTAIALSHGRRPAVAWSVVFGGYIMWVALLMAVPS